MIELRVLGSLVLHDPDNGDLGSILARPKLLALLVYLALARPNGLRSRDTLVGLFWPESGQSRARHALNQALYELRKALGEGVIVSRGDEEVGLDRARFWCDAEAFEAALDAGAGDDALDLYAGDLLCGFALSGCEEFESWLDERREGLRMGALAAVRERAAELASADEHGEAAYWLRRGLRWEPYDEDLARRLLEALVAGGDRTGALREYETFARRLTEDLGVEPSAEMADLAERARSSGKDTPDYGRVVKMPRPVEAGEVTEFRRHRHGRRTALGLVFLVVLVGAFVLRSDVRAKRSQSMEPSAKEAATVLESRRVFVAPFQNRTGEPDLEMVGLMAADWVTQGLVATGLVSVVPGSMEFWVPSDSIVAGVPLGPALDAARETKSRSLVYGAFYRQGEYLVFQTSIVDAATGEIRRAIGDVRAREPEAAVEELRRRLMAALATTLDSRMEAWSVAVHQPPDFRAYQKYAEGLTLFFTPGRRREAGGVLMEAGAMDSTFVMPLLWAGFTPVKNRDSLMAVLHSRREHMSPLERAILDYLVGLDSYDGRVTHEAALRAVSIAPGSEWNYKLAFEALYLNLPGQALQALLDTNPSRGWMKEWPSYWSVRLNARHALGDHGGELKDAILFQEQYPDMYPHYDAALQPAFTEVRALIALGRPDEAMERVRRWASHPERECLAGRSAFEFRAHGYPRHALRTAAWIQESYQARSAASRDTLETMGADCLIDLYYLLGDAGRMRDLAHRSLEERPEDPTLLMRWGVAAAMLGDTIEAREADARLSALDSHRFVSWRRLCIPAHLGETDRALDILESLAEKGTSYPGLHRSLCADPLRKHPRFKVFMQPKG